MTSAIDFLPTISSCQAVSQINRSPARWGPHAGNHASADVVISMDADLQDDIHAIGKMLLAYEAGSDLVLGVRSDRTSDNVQKRGTAGAYYKILSLLGVNIVENHADFRLMSKRALAAPLLHNEINLFLRVRPKTSGRIA